MKPTIDFHHVASIKLTPVQDYTRSTDGSPFAARSIVLTDAAGNVFRIGLFADTADALVVDMTEHAPEVSRA